MRDVSKIQSTNMLLSMYVDTLEPDSTKESTNRTVRILDAIYEKANLPKMYKIIVLT